MIFINKLLLNINYRIDLKYFWNYNVCIVFENWFLEEMMETAKKTNLRSISLLFFLTYMVSYITRTNYGAIIAEMEVATDMSRELLSMALTGSFITYGIGQIISGIIGDRFSPKNLVSIGLLSTLIMNLLIPICTNPYQMLLVWCINGFAQSLMWPPIVKLMAELLSSKEYNSATVVVTCGGSVGTITVYLISPIIISLLGFKWVFVVSAVIAALMLLFWQKYAPNVDIKSIAKSSKTKGNIKILFTPLMIAIMVVIILQGSLRDGVTTWMPTYISNTYNLSSIVSILTGVLLPIFSIVSINVTAKLYKNLFNNPVLCGGVIFGVGALSAVVLCLFTGQSAMLSVVFSALLAAAMHGVNQIFVCILPSFFKKYGNVSTVSGVLNSCTYIGSAISTYGIAVLSKNFGWSMTLVSWLIIAVVGTSVCFACFKTWAKNMAE